MKILVSGGSGLIGSALTAAATAAGHHVRKLSRSNSSNILWDPERGSIDRGAIEGFDAVVVMGSPWSVYGPEVEPWIADLFTLLREADRLGIQTMYDAGYDPRGMAGIFETLLEHRQRRPNAVAAFFSTHPLTEARIADARAASDALPRRTNLVRNDGRLESVQREVGR